MHSSVSRVGTFQILRCRTIGTALTRPEWPPEGGRVVGLVGLCCFRRIRVWGLRVECSMNSLAPVRFVGDWLLGIARVVSDQPGESEQIYWRKMTAVISAIVVASAAIIWVIIRLRFSCWRISRSRTILLTGW